jgi:ABC-2 type transport system permease protein
MILLALIKKEILILSRDIHGLLLLFVMPLIFIIVMSLALRDAFSHQEGKSHGLHIRVQVIDGVNNTDSAALLEYLKKNKTFVFEEDRDGQNNAGRNSAGEKLAPLTLSLQSSVMPPGLIGLPRQIQSGINLSITVEPDTEHYVLTLFTSLLREAQASLLVSKLKLQLQNSGSDPALLALLSSMGNIPEPGVIYRYQGQQPESEERIIPNATQQNVPAWMVFAMFFVVVPLSNALLSEHYSGTLRRLRTFNLSPLMLLVGKLIPYFVINQLQVVSMLCAGYWLLPLIGGDRLLFGDSITGLCILSASVSVAALGYALFIATLASSTEQATTLGGVGNILLAAIGGVMVPVFVMPPFMQQAAEFSPMFWAVDGFLDIMLRGGDAKSVLFEAALLCGFGLLLLFLASVLLQRRWYR